MERRRKEEDLIKLEICVLEISECLVSRGITAIYNGNNNNKIIIIVTF